MSVLGLIAVLVALALGAAWCAGWLVLGAWALADRHPGLRDAAAAGVVPALVASVVLGVSAAFAAAVPFGHGCHCELGALSAIHLCFDHPERALPLLPVAWVILAAFAWRGWQQLRLVSRRLAAARALARGSRRIGWTTVPLRNALSLGIPRPRIVVDSAWWRELNPSERRIVLAHEAAHLRRGDPVVLELLELLARLSPTRLAGRALAGWRARAERLADAAAARRVRDPVAVAALLVKLHRRAPSSALGMAVQDGHGLARRVRALLAGSEPPHAPNDFGVATLTVVTGAAVIPIVASNRVHHAIESLLALLP